MLTILFGILVGLSLGLTGGGGSIFAVPLLIIGLNVAPLQATTISLAAVTVSAAYGSIIVGKARMVEWRAALIMVAAGMLTAPAGVTLAQHISAPVIVKGFAVLMLVVALLMAWRTWRNPASANVVRAGLIDDLEKGSTAICRLDENAILRLSTPCGIVLFLAGCVTGTLSGLFGVGGGFLIVPALTFVTQISIHRAVASSLFIIALVGISGVFTAISQGRELPVTLTVLFILGGLAGMFLGQRVAKKMPARALQKVFIGIIVVVAVVTFVWSR